MSFSIVKRSLELFNEEDSNAKSTSGRKSDKKSNAPELVVRHGNANKSKLKRQKKLKKKLALVKNHTITAFDERKKYEAIDQTSHNLQFMRDLSILHVADEKTIDTIVQHQRGKLAKDRLSSSTNDKKDTSRGSVFTDKDFDTFEKEYAF